MREYDLRLKEFSISRHRFRELKEFCLQYEEKKSELYQIYTSSASAPEVAVKGGVPGKPTEVKAMRAAKLKAETDMIDRCLFMACGEDKGIVEPLKKNVVRGLGYDRLGYVPCAPRLFYKYRRKFYFLLDKEKG